MSPVLALMGLLVLSYLGSFLVGGRAVRGLGLPSGAEYVALGFLVGPHLLGLVDRSLFDAFEPVAHVALGWLALVVGLDYGYVGHRRGRVSSFLLGIAGALLTWGLVTGAVLFVCTVVLRRPSGVDLWLLAGGLGAVCVETTRHGIRWVFERYGAKGALAYLIAEVAYADDLVALLATGALFALVPSSHGALAVPFVGWVGITVGLGLGLGAMTALLLGKEFELHSTWGFLLGTALLGVGTAARLSLSGLSVMFFMGVAMNVVSSHRRQLRVMVARTERPVLLPALLLAGARLDLAAARPLAVCVAVAVVARVAGKVLSGFLVRASSLPARSASPLLGFGLLSSGALSLAIGLSFAMRFPGLVGDTVLVAAAVSAVLGEFFAPATLRHVLRRAGELAEAPPAAPPPEPVPS